MAFAYSQLGDIHNAGEAFLHAFQAAKDSGNNILQSKKNIIQTLITLSPDCKNALKVDFLKQ